jgi:hypothetical protein
MDEVLAPATEAVNCTEKIPQVGGDVKCIPETAYDLTQPMTPTKIVGIY